MLSILSFLNRRFEEVLGAFLLAVMACIAFINVIIRYCTSMSFASSEELTVNFFVWIVLLGTSCAFREGANFCMSLLYNALPKGVRLGLYLFGAACCVAFFAALFYLGAVEVWDEYDLNVSSEALAIPAWWYTIITPIGALLCIVRLGQRFVADLRNGTY